MIRRFFRALALCALFVLCVVLLADGKMAGDEGFVHGMARSFFLSDAGFVDFLLSNRNYYLSHQMLWLVEKIAVVAITETVSAMVGGGHFASYLASFDTVAAMLAAGLLAHRALRRLHPPAVADFTIALFALGGFGVSFLTGGMVECLMAPLMALRLLWGDGRMRSRPPRFALLGVVDALLIGFKPYGLVFLVLTWPTLPWRDGGKRSWLVYGAGLLGPLLVVGALKFMAGNPAHVVVFSTLDPARMAGNLFDQVFSVSLGLLWCCPLFLLVGLAGRRHRRALLWKGAGLAATMVFLSMFSFWHGAAGIAGPRYIYPFLIAFLPELAAGAAALARMWRPAAIGLCLLPLAFLPTVDYRNTLVQRYANWSDARQPASIGSVPQIAHFDIGLHPAVFAWRAVFAQASGRPLAQAAIDGGVPQVLSDIPPSSGVSRLAYIVERKPPEAAPFLRLLQKAGLDRPAPWQALRLAVFLVLLALPLAAAARLCRSAGSGPVSSGAAPARRS